MGKSQRTKGAGGERELCALLSAEFGLEVKRALDQAREGGGDIRLSPFRIECKRRASFNTLYKWMEQAEASTHILPQTEAAMRAMVWETPVVAVRADGRPWLVVMRLPDWMKLAREEVST